MVNKEYSPARILFRIKKPVPVGFNMPRPIPIKDFVKNALVESYFELHLSELSDAERKLISKKIDLVALRMGGGDILIEEIMDGIVTRTLRSKLLTLIIGFRHTAVMLGFKNIERRLSQALEVPAPPIRLSQATYFSSQADKLIQEIISRSKLSFH